VRLFGVRRGGRLDRDEPWAIWQLGFDAGHDGRRTFRYDFLERRGSVHDSRSSCADLQRRRRRPSRCRKS
jgi:hypothetical protein